MGRFTDDGSWIGNREVPFEPDATCDWCGARGGFDFMGDSLCSKCAGVYEQTYAGQLRKLCAAVDDLKEAMVAAGLGRPMFAVMAFLARLIAAWERARAKYNV